ncbi:agamous-like MADS-box protein AGL53 [Quercus lobata]|uniref:MADS-box domain-containing protein n=1 Tax=Quercus lobata TaxID=97700 RepID=A0A7N2R4S0_QUELO|nr:agamous-like MADS-box protein AGL53 [Quercus lobata]
MEASQPKQPEPQKKRRVRKTSFKLRNPTLKKKAMELSALCDIPVCVISYDAAEGADGKAETWPESRDDVKALIHDYKNYHGVHKKFSLVNKKKGYKEIKKKDVDSSHEHKPEEFKRVLAMWKAWLNEQHDEKSLERSWTFFDSMVCTMNKRIELLRMKRNSNYEVGSSSGSGNSGSNNNRILEFDLNN